MSAPAVGRRQVCIHGHFYQPPRENPWLGVIERQESAAPFHDWNERITAESYRPNAPNYAGISFNFGPTLLSWMEPNAPEVYRAILEADGKSRGRFSGHGNAIAQAYNHMILPLANRRDRITQVRWGIRDFRHRFGRQPEGMWLAETAADTESLDVLAEHGIRFTILAPAQARRVREIGGTAWEDVSGGDVDPTMPYEVRLACGRTIAVFFYDGSISQAIAFQDLLSDGDRLAERLLAATEPGGGRGRLVHVATDGETYGHHHKFGEMALARALERIEADPDVNLTNHAEHLERHAPTHEAEILEPSSWSCPHGVGRWQTDCGCSTGGQPGWSQAWRGPLREALDGLRDRLAPRWEQAAGELFGDPWAARDDYIDVVLDPGARERFWARHGPGRRDRAERTTGERLLELQHNAMLMYTSCGWFFDDLSRIETVQVLMYAGRVIQLARDVLGVDPEPPFLDVLGRARSNVPEGGDGRKIWESRVRPRMASRAG